MGLCRELRARCLGLPASAPVIDHPGGRLKKPRALLDNRPNRLRVLPTIRVVHVRRALLLFAIVIGLAAIAASLSRSGDDEASRPPAQATTTTTTEPEPAPEASPREDTTAVAEDGDTIELNAAEDDTRRLEAGRSVSIEVAVVDPGQVSIPLLGLTGAADPLTPARFDVLVNSEGRYPIEFTPAGSGEPRSAGTIVVTPPSG